MAEGFLYSQPVKIRFGADALPGGLEETLRELGCRKAVIVCGRHFEPKARALSERFPEIAGIFAGVEPNPQLSGAVKTAEIAREAGADTVIGIGGGSALDTAKFAAAIAPGSASPDDYYTGAVPFPARPLSVIAVPTTAGTGSEVTQVAVISRGKEKRTINHPVFMPKAAIVDPLLSLSVPSRTAMCTGLDALAHALEGYWSRNHQPISDLMAVEAVRLILKNLEQVWTAGPGKDLPAHSAMAMASLLGGLSFALPKTAGCHACSYPLSEDYHLSHGEACAFTLDSFVRINADARLEELCRRVGLAGTEELAGRIRHLKGLAHLKCRLSDLGTVDLEKLCRDAAAHPLMKNNPAPMDENALRAMFEALV